jgi:hypothetical protein
MAIAPDTEKTSRLWSRLSAGYDSLTLDPSPTLRQMQQDLSRPSDRTIRSAWTSVGSALAAAMRTAVQALRAGQSS